MLMWGYELVGINLVQDVMVNYYPTNAPEFIYKYRNKKKVLNIPNINSLEYS